MRVLIAGILFGTLLQACDGDFSSPFSIIDVAKISPAADTLVALNETSQLTVAATNRWGDNVRVGLIRWASSDPAVASVGSQGLVTAHRNGEVTITATSSRMSADAKILVRQEIAALQFVNQSAAAVAGEPMPVTVEIQDAGGHAVAGLSVPVSVALEANPGNATLLGTTVVTSIDGVAAFTDLSLRNAASGYTLRASTGALSAAISAPFSVTPAAVMLSFLTQPGSTEGQVPFNPAVQVTAREDQFGNVVSAAAVSLTAVSSSGEGLHGTTTVTAVNGVATFDGVYLALPGDGVSLEARSGGATPVRSTTFSVRLTFASLTPGKSHTCGLTTAGFAYCWGFHGNGVLGDGTFEERQTPSAVTGGMRFTQLSAGGDHTCGVRTGNVAYCWGSNSDGQLGEGLTISRSLTPIPVAGGLSFSQLSAGDQHTCGVTTANVLYCWGQNRDGRLGDGTTDLRTIPTIVAGVLAFKSVTAGGSHTCGITTANVAYCWGENFIGQVGDGTTTTRFSPTAVAGGLTFATIRTGFEHTCGVTTGQVAYCWGANTAGQLGDGTTTAHSVPTAVSGSLSFAQVSAGTDHSCGVTTANVGYCWGFNDYGRLGDGTSTQHETPVAVSGGLSFTAIHASSLHTCGLAVGNVPYCWAFDGNGRLGNGPAGDSLVPVQVVH